MTVAQVGIIVSIVVYLAGMLVVGFLASRKTNDVGDFYLGGRKLGPFVTAMSAEASDMSSYLLMGVPGLAYFSGIADAGWTAIGLAVGTYLNWLFTAKRLRNYTARLDAITLPEYFKKRFKDEKNVTLLIGALAIIIFFVPYTASGFSACGKLFAVIPESKELIQLRNYEKKYCRTEVSHYACQHKALYSPVEIGNKYDIEYKQRKCCEYAVKRVKLDHSPCPDKL